MSLLETLITLTLISLLALGCFSTYSHYYQHKALEQSATQFIGALRFTKNAATLTGETVYLCASSNNQTCNADWQGALLVFTSQAPPEMTTVLQRFPALPQDVRLSMTLLKDPPLYFMENGETADNGSLTFTDGSHALYFTLSTTGIVKPAKPH